MIVKRGPTFGPVISMTNTCKILVDKYCEILDGLEVSYIRCGRQLPGNRKYHWVVQVAGRPRVSKMLGILSGLLVAKKQQALKANEWLASRALNIRVPYTEEQHSLVIDLKKLNGRGREFSEHALPVH